APLLLDVREPPEFAAGHLPGAVSLPLSVLEARAAEVPATGPVVVYCQGGTRSARAVALLQAGLGLMNLRSLEGGIQGFGEG
ncbi:rhodanese-like domain-containing protein, partial [Hymenobacter lapidiphilus]|uniref:rhodanese-like domain-containing protein n=1 Tax=Hymenobacter sp. CCM 8763 TaxID=2303334 RepID=UPI000E8EBE36